LVVNWAVFTVCGMCVCVCVCVGDILLEYITSQNAADHSEHSCTPTTETECEQQQQHKQWKDEAEMRTESRVKLTVQHLLSRLSLSQLRSLVDETDASKPDVSNMEVHVIRSTNSRADDNELRQVGESLARLLQLLRHCTNWNELLSVDASLSDALARLTEHEFSGGTMGYGVHTEKSVERLAGMLTVSETCAVDSVQQQLDTAPQWMNLKGCELRVTADDHILISVDDDDELECRQPMSVDVRVTDKLVDECEQLQQSVSDSDASPSQVDTGDDFRTEGDVTQLKTGTGADLSELQMTLDDCRLDIANSLTSCRRRVNRCCHVDRLDNEQACDTDHASDSDESPVNSGTS